jgi:hypothetical protein
MLSQSCQFFKPISSTCLEEATATSQKKLNLPLQQYFRGRAQRKWKLSVLASHYPKFLLTRQFVKILQLVIRVRTLPSPDVEGFEFCFS